MSRKKAKVQPAREITSMADLQPDKHNANKGTGRGRAMLESSVRQYGLGRSIVVDKQGRVIAGNKTMETATGVGIKDMIVVRSDGQQLIVHQRTDLDLETDVEARELGIADNRTSEVGLQWDAEQLKALAVDGAQMQQFFRDGEWAKMHNVSEAIGGDPIEEMAIQPFEHHDYIMVVFKDSHAWTKACDLLGIKRQSVTVGGRRKIGLGRVIPAERLLEVLDKRSVKKPKPAAAGPKLVEVTSVEATKLSAAPAV